MTKPLTVKETKLIKAKANGATHIEAYHKVYSPTAANSTAAQNTTKILQKPHVKEALEKALKKHDISLDNALAPIGKALKAKKIIFHGKDSGEAFAEEVEDIELQLKGSDRALKLMGVTGQSEGNNIQTNFVQIINQKADKYAD